MVRRTLLTALAVACASPAFALYDPEPDASLAAVQGEWTGSLRYRDYRQPDRMVTLPTRLFVALAAPNELVLHYVFNDGPGKTVYSYERMRFDAGRKEVSWTSGAAEKSETVSRIVASVQDGEVRRLVFERDSDKGKDRFTFESSAAALSLQKEEVSASGVALLRNRFEFRRPGR